MDGIDSLIDNYIAIWNESDPARRRELIARTWTEDATYLDPLMSGDGPDGIDAMIQAAQEQFPNHQIRRTGEVDAHHDRVRFEWELVPPSGGAPVVTGLDFGVVAADGRLQSITGFLTQVSQAPRG